MNPTGPIRHVTFSVQNDEGRPMWSRGVKVQLFENFKPHETHIVTLLDSDKKVFGYGPDEVSAILDCLKSLLSVGK